MSDTSSAPLCKTPRIKPGAKAAVFSPDAADMPFNITGTPFDITGTPLDATDTPSAIAD